MVTPLIDFDVLVYEVGFGVQTGWDSPDPPPFEMARELLENKIANICAIVNGIRDTTEPYIGYLTGEGNFRETIAKNKPYKGTRNSPKPYHYDNLRAYMVGVLGAIMVDGMEADDAMSIAQIKALNTMCDENYYFPETIICSRDKDLRTVPGWVYSWELGNQPSFGPDFCNDYGWISLSENRKKVVGRGDKFFLAQCIMGDRVDNIEGIPKCGPSKAFDLLVDTKTYEEGLSLVLEAYKGFYGDDGEKNLLENGRLLYMTRELNEKGEPVLWTL